MEKLNKKRVGRKTQRLPLDELRDLYSNHTTREIAEMLDVNENTVKGWIHYYRHKFAKDTIDDIFDDIYKNDPKFAIDGELDYRRLIKDTIDDIHKNDPNLHVWNYVEYFEKILDIKLDMKWKRFIRAYLCDLHRLRYFPNLDLTRSVSKWEFIEFYLENDYKEFISDINDPESIKKSRLDIEEYTSRLRDYGLGFAEYFDFYGDNLVLTVAHMSCYGDVDDDYLFSGLKEPQEEENYED